MINLDFLQNWRWNKAVLGRRCLFLLVLFCFEEVLLVFIIYVTWFLLVASETCSTMRWNGQDQRGSPEIVQVDQIPFTRITLTTKQYSVSSSISSLLFLWILHESGWSPLNVAITYFIWVTKKKNIKKMLWERSSDSESNLRHFASPDEKSYNPHHAAFIQVTGYQRPFVILLKTLHFFRNVSYLEYTSVDMDTRFSIFLQCAVKSRFTLRYFFSICRRYCRKECVVHSNGRSIRFSWLI